MAGEFTLFDHAKMFDAKGESILPVANVLQKSDPILSDAITIESNMDSGHQYAVMTGMPEVTWRRAYEGVAPSKSTRKVVNETYGRASTVSLVDVAIAEKGGKVNEVRAEESERHLEAMSQELASKLIYGSVADDEKSFVGFAARYSSSTAGSAKNLIRVKTSAGGTTRRSSIYLVGWGKGKIFTFYPKGTTAGIKHYDFGGKPIDIVDANGRTYPGYKDQYECLMGLGVQDWRYGARIANIDLDDLDTKAKCIALYDKFIQALDAIQNFNGIKLVAYCNREVKLALRNGFIGAGGSAIAYDGSHVVTAGIQTTPTMNQNGLLTSSGNIGYSAHDLVIDGVHIKAEDAIVSNEALIS